MQRVGINNGDLVKGDQNSVYIIQNETRCPVTKEVFEKYNFNYWAVKKFADYSLVEIPIGPPLQ